MISAKTFGVRLRAKRIWLGPVGDRDAHFDMADKVNKMYRMGVPKIVGFWTRCRNVLERMAVGLRNDVTVQGSFGGPLDNAIGYDNEHSVFGRPTPGFMLPNGFWILYPNLRYAKGDEGQELVYDHLKGGKFIKVRIHAGVLFNNINQGLAFAILMCQGVAIDKELRRIGIGRVVMNVHDEWLAIAQRGSDEYAVSIMDTQMRTLPPWLVDKGGESLPIDCETHVGENYGEV